MRYYDQEGNRISEANGLLLLGLALTVLTTSRGDVVISTIFLAVDVSPGVGPPRLWETMIFQGPMDGEQRWSPTREEAERTHDRVVAVCRAALDLEGTAISKMETLKKGIDGAWETTTSR